MELLKETKVWRVENESEAVNLIEDFKNKALESGYTVNKSGYTMKTKKSKGEIIDMWFIVTVEFRYDL